MTIARIIERVDERKPNAFSEEQKLRWIAELDGRIALDVMLMSITDAESFRYSYPEDMQSQPLVRFPHEALYEAWLGAMIDLANGEYARYQNSMELFNAQYGAFVRWFAATYAPAQGYYEEGY